MDPPGGRRAGMSGNATAAGGGNASSPSAVGLMPARSPAAPLVGGSNRAAQQQQQQHCGNVTQQHHQYPSALGPPPLIRTSMVHSAGSLLSVAPQLMLSTVSPTSAAAAAAAAAASAAAAEAIPRYQPHQLQGAATTPPATPSSNAAAVAAAVSSVEHLSALGMVSPFGILPHERVVPQQQTHHHHRHQNRKMPGLHPASKSLVMDGVPQLLASSVANPQRFYDEPLGGNKMKDFDGVQHHRLKMANGVVAPDKGQPAASGGGGYSPQPYELRYQPRTPGSQQVGYLSVITRTAVTTANSAVMDDVTSNGNNNYYQTQAPSALHLKTTDHHHQDRQYYHFDGQTPQQQQQQQQHQQVDGGGMLIMGNPVQRGDPMHIVKNLQSMQADTDCYGVKKIIEQQQPRLHLQPSMDNGGKIAVGPIGPLNNNGGGKCPTGGDGQHQNHPSLAYNGQYFNRRQPPPAHLHQHHNQSHVQQHLASGNGKMQLPVPQSLTVVPANGGSYFDQRHHRWNMQEPQKPPTISTPSCFSGNVSAGMFHQPPQQQYNSSAVSTFNVPAPGSGGVHQHQQQQQMSESAHHNSFIVSSGSPTYYGLTTAMASPAVTSVTTTSPTVQPFNRHQQQYPANCYPSFAGSAHAENFTQNEDNRLLALPVIVPNIEEELGHLCDDSLSPTGAIVKPSNVVIRKPSFIDSYIRFLNGDTSAAVVETEDECFEKPKKIQRPKAVSPPKLISKPYIPLSKPKAPVVTVSETRPSSCNGPCESVKNVVTTTDDDPRYFPLPKTSASSTVLSDGSNSDNDWLSDDVDHDHWWTSSSKMLPSKSVPSVIKSKPEGNKKKCNSAVRKKQSNCVTTTKKRKTQHEKQPRRQSSHRLAKEKSQNLITRLKSDDDGYSDADSDVDPAWIPNDDNDVSKNSCLTSNRRHFNHKKFSKDQCSNSDNSPSTSSLVNNNNRTENLTMPFKSGSFVALKSQFAGKDHEQPQLLWRVDGKSLLQKFQRVSKKTYRSATTYTGWGPAHYSMYRQVAIKFITPESDANYVQNKVLNTEVVVKLVSDDDDDDDDISEDDSIASPTDTDSSTKRKSSTSADDTSIKNLRSNFDVFIQSLTSQALDSSFLDTIYRENDEFFMSNMHAIESVTESCIQAVDSIIAQDALIDFSKVENVCTLVTRYPDMEMLKLDEIAVRNTQLLCIVCGRRGFVGKKVKFVEMSFFGPKYHPRLLTDVDANEADSKTYPMKKRAHCCSSIKCIDKMEILHSLKHLKYRIYKECCERITVENNSCYESTKETTSVLNRILADEQWIIKLFQTVSKIWSRAKKFISNKQSNC